MEVQGDSVSTQETPELTEHEQEMINLVQEREQTARASADPSLAEPTAEEAPQQEEEKQTAEEVGDRSLDIKQDEEVKEPDVEGVLTPSELNKFTEEYNSNGELSEDSYKELQKLGVSKEVVDTYIEGQNALQEVRVNKVYNEVGGAESYKTLVEWAKENWDQQQIEVFNRNVNSGDEALTMFSVKALKDTYEKANGSQIPTRALKGSGQGVSNDSSVRGFESKQEMFKAMRDPAYGRDPSYTKMVEDKIKRSNLK